MTDPRQWRWIFVLAGAWFFAGMLPLVLILKERTPPTPEGGAGSVLVASYRQLAHTVREAGRFGQLGRFLAAFFVYSMGTNATIFFAGIIGEEMGFTIGHLTLLALLMASMSGVAAILAARNQDRIGHRRTISIVLMVWVISTLGLAMMRLVNAPSWIFWLVAAGIGLGIGGIGTGSRAMIGLFTPPSRSGEFFGLWGMTYKLAAVAGVGLFGLVSTSFTPLRTGQVAALFMLSGFFALGLVMLLVTVDERKGLRQAQEGEKAFREGPTERSTSV